MDCRKRSLVSELLVVSAGINKYNFGMGRNSQITGMVVNIAKSKKRDRDRSRVMCGMYGLYHILWSILLCGDCRH